MWSRPLGFGLRDDLASMTAAGLPPFAALRAATAGAAEFLSFRGGGAAEYATVDQGGIRFTSGVAAEVDFGRIEVGMRADLVLLEGNPLDDVRNVGRVGGVMLRGRWLSRDELDELLDAAARALGGAALRQDD